MEKSWCRAVSFFFTVHNNLIFPALLVYSFKLSKFRAKLCSWETEETVRCWKGLKIILEISQNSSFFCRVMRLRFGFTWKTYLWLGLAYYDEFLHFFGGLSTSWNESSVKTGSADAANNSGKIPKQAPKSWLNYFWHNVIKYINIFEHTV